MNEEIVEEIYNRLVERFGIGEVFLPKHGKRKIAITWKQFIKAALELKLEELAIYCGFTFSKGLSRALKEKYPGIIQDKNGEYWFLYLCKFLSKKRCSKCLVVLEYNEFNSNSSTKDGLSSTCRHCDKEYRDLNKEHILAHSKQYYSKHKKEISANKAKRRATKLQATPNWANLIAIKEIYRTCPEGYHVDHIVPLQNDLVCGLHCEFNLQHLSASENLSKGNRFEVD